MYTASGGLDAYEGMLVEEINCTPGQEYILVQGLHEPLRLGVPVGDVDQDLIKSQQIEETIRQHLDKSLQLRDLGIKVLSLFFIDRVANCIYPEEGPYQNGKYALMFEEKFRCWPAAPDMLPSTRKTWNRWQRLCMVAISPRTKRDTKIQAVIQRGMKILTPSSWGQGRAVIL